MSPLLKHSLSRRFVRPCPPEHEINFPKIGLPTRLKSPRASRLLCRMHSAAYRSPFCAVLSFSPLEFTYSPAYHTHNSASVRAKCKMIQWRFSLKKLGVLRENLARHSLGKYLKGSKCQKQALLRKDRSKGDPW